MPEALSTNWFAQQFKRTQPLFHQLDKNPTSLIDFVAKRKTYRLGVYFEHLIAFWLQNHPTYQLLAHDLQVFEGKQTKGAFDFLVSDGQGVHHWETCIKFYLSLNNSPHWMNWVGPHQKDRLGLKLNKTLNHQLQLSNTPSGQQALIKNNIALPTSKKMWIKGILFTHWQTHPAQPRQGFPAKGIWMYADELPDYLKDKSKFQWFVRKKPNWLSSVIAADQPLLAAKDLLDYHFVRTTMFSEKLKSERVESKRIFICPASHRHTWPDLIPES